MTHAGPAPKKQGTKSRRWRRWVLLLILLIPIVGLLWVTDWYRQRAELFDGADVKLTVPASKWLRLFGDEIAEVYFGDPIKLHIDNDHLTPRQLKLIGSYNRLESLTLVGVSDDDLQFLGDLPQLEQLRIQSQHLTGDGLRHLVKLDRLRWLTLEAPQLTDEGLRHLAKLNALQDLTIESPHLTDKGLQYLEELRGLQDLLIDGGAISKEGMRGLTGISTLSGLSLHHVVFSGDPFRPLITRGNIRRLDVRRSTLNENMLQSLVENDYLQEVYVYDTGISDEACQRFYEKLYENQPTWSARSTDAMPDEPRHVESGSGEL